MRGIHPRGEEEGRSGHSLSLRFWSAPPPTRCAQSGRFGWSRKQSRGKVPGDWDEIKTVRRTKRDGAQRAESAELLPPTEHREGREEEGEVVELRSHISLGHKGLLCPAMNCWASDPTNRAKAPSYEGGRGGRPLPTWAANERGAAKVAIGEAVSEGHIREQPPRDR